MNIDFYILLRWLSVTFTRSGFAMFLKPISEVFSNLYTSIKNWQKDIVLQSAITCQVMYMELIINYRIFGNYNRTIYITDGDQVTVDFIVNVPQGVTYNVQLLIGLLEKYKATGKRYTIEQTQFAYEVVWTDFVCEKVVEQITTYEAVWSDFVCEKVSTVVSNLIRLSFETHAITVHAQYPVASDINVYYEINNGAQSGYVVLQEMMNSVALGFETSIANAKITGILPASDEFYNYYYLEIQ